MTSYPGVILVIILYLPSSQSNIKTFLLYIILKIWQIKDKKRREERRYLSCFSPTSNIYPELGSISLESFSFLSNFWKDAKTRYYCPVAICRVLCPVSRALTMSCIDCRDCSPIFRDSSLSTRRNIDEQPLLYMI